jgi:hypothetical protein
MVTPGKARRPVQVCADSLDTVSEVSEINNCLATSSSTAPVTIN